MHAMYASCFIIIRPMVQATMGLMIMILQLSVSWLLERFSSVSTAFVGFQLEQSGG